MYISLMRSYDYMKKAMESMSLDQKRIVFINSVSGYAFTKDDKVDEAFYYKPPQNIAELKEIIRVGIKKSTLKKLLNG